MYDFKRTAAASAIALMLAAGSAAAQGTVVGTDALDDRIDDIQREAEDEIRRAEDSARFGNAEFAPGWSGSMSASYAGASGNTDTQDFSLGGRFNYNINQWSHTLGFAAEFGEDGGVKTKEQAFVIYDANYRIGDRFYVFGLGRLQADNFGPLQQDAFLGVGPGYRLINTETLAWRVQAGPGVRYTKTNVGDDATEAALVASSRFFYRISDAVFLTNDTDVLYSDVGTLATNDFGVSYSMTDMISTRLGYRTEYNSDPTGGAEKTDNTLGVSLVYSF